VSDDRRSVAAGLLPDDAQHRALLQAITDTARAIFHAKAASVFLYDEDSDELVFEAVSGEGEQALVGRRFPSGTGIAGWVLATNQAIVLDDVTRDVRFSEQAAASTGYVPRALMAVPLLYGDRSVGVLEVLDRASGERFTLDQATLLELFATQAAVALDLLRRSRAARSALETDDGDAGLIAGLTRALEAVGEPQRTAGYQLLAALSVVLEPH